MSRPDYEEVTMGLRCRLGLHRWRVTFLPTFSVTLENLGQVNAVAVCDRCGKVDA